MYTAKVVLVYVCLCASVQKYAGASDCCMQIHTVFISRINVDLSVCVYNMCKICNTRYAVRSVINRGKEEKEKVSLGTPALHTGP